MSCQLLCGVQRVGFGPRLSATLLQGEAEDERAVAAAQEEAVAGVEREVALLHTRLRLLAHHAWSDLLPHTPSPSCWPLSCRLLSALQSLYLIALSE